MLTRLGLSVIWFLHWLPLSVQAAIGNTVGLFLYAVVVPRRRVALKNLRLCFPALTEHERRILARRTFQHVARAFLERGLLWWAPESRLRRLIRIEGLQHLQRLKAEGRPVILLAPHFVGLDIGGIGLALDLRVVSVYSHQKNPVLDARLLKGRSRFNAPLLLSRQDGVRATVRAMKDGLPLYYLPDLDFGPRDAVFVPFFGIPTATITGLSRLGRLAGAAVVPIITKLLPGGAGYVVTLEAPWDNYPTDDATADTAQMNAWLEQRVRVLPDQYYWVHKRFKTRPPGEPKFY